MCDGDGHCMQLILQSKSNNFTKNWSPPKKFYVYIYMFTYLLNQCLHTFWSSFFNPPVRCATVFAYFNLKKLFMRQTTNAVMKTLERPKLPIRLGLKLRVKNSATDTDYETSTQIEVSLDLSTKWFWHGFCRSSEHASIQFSTTEILREDCFFFCFFVIVGVFVFRVCSPCEGSRVDGQVLSVPSCLQ